MKWLRWIRFFRNVEYIKELEKISETLETSNSMAIEAMERMERQIAVLKHEKANIEIENINLKKTPPEPKLASNIDITDPIFQKMIKAGRSVLVKKAHPDHGGSREEFEEVEKAYKILKTLKIQPQKEVYSGLGGLRAYQDIYSQQMSSMAAAQRQHPLYRGF